MQAQTLTVRQFCDRYNLSHSTFYRLVKAGKAPQAVRIGRRVLIPADAAQAWLERNLSHTE